VISHAYLEVFIVVRFNGFSFVKYCSC